MASVQGAEVKVMGLTKTYGSNQVLRSLDLDIAPGEFIAIVGRSGGGKSTLLRMIAGFERPTDGGVLIDGEPLRGRNRSARTMFQNARLLPWERVLDNVGLGLDKKDWREKAEKALRQVGLAERAGDWPAVLSGGQKQRVALARALVREPRLLLLDEPLGALDAMTRLELIERIWQKRKFSAFLITHDVDEAIMLGDRIVLIEDGRVTMDKRVTLPRPRKRKDQEFLTLAEEVLERVMGDEAGLINGERDKIEALASA
ncbi:MAG: Aliphatic sulfonates import ATP-binding protein SsuB [Chroococcidiopsis cubana SAG 39.79]|uniref:Aliphatic sulfonates import ATP-binding protein SsuB n=1 Tax=Chroococcidiopsis cubana SAG 39.79 TaxID=388085 RepID=A0AB37U9V9_9CYAN|nr:ATP-binding cassette domain-containing protein [Chroococcidiopsis cubana]MDZ4876619.1 Aliphatic sulfonates import ATP-binding protein SsuB [Chroococcidiopsis cubana SAG 39.79]PSB62902.1 aliphatic sulfonate ABC transporter ATP-binding protein [Chroococcidiopsis cubana CCALA 043]RUT00512.1 aliphatic sulfonates import ATP-binding protein SsuB [Chroococcidiopsis cubana SAG 39.79]